MKIKKKSKQHSSQGYGGREQILSAGRPQIVSKHLEQTASQNRGPAISCAPALFEIIKKSLGGRIDAIASTLVSKQLQENGSVIKCFSLDKKLLSTLKELITRVTDACIDPRNFDNAAHRKIAEDVNDSMVIFLRDMFSNLDQREVCSLILIYFSRFLTTEGKLMKTGKHVFEEWLKLRLNALTLLVRFPDFVEMNNPIMQHWEGFLRPKYKPTPKTQVLLALKKMKKLKRLYLQQLTLSFH